MLYALGFLGVYTIGLTLIVMHIWTELKAMQKSTHSIQYVPATDFETLNEKTKENLTKDLFDNVM